VEVKGVKEFKQDFIFGLLTVYDVGVFLGAVNSTEVVNSNGSGFVLVHNLEGLHADVFAEIVHLSNDRVKIFVEVNRATSVFINEIEETFSVLLVETDCEVMDALDELGFLELSVAVVIGNPEGATESRNTTSSSLRKSGSELSV